MKDETAKAFAKALSEMPERVSRSDMATFIIGMLSAYDYSETERLILAALIGTAPQDKIDVCKNEAIAKCDAREFLAKFNRD